MSKGERKEDGTQDVEIVCRCNDVTKKEVLDAIESGITNLELLRKHLRIGMGPCQGRTCIPILAQILARETSKPIESLSVPKSRSPVLPVPIKFLRSEGGKKNEG